MAELAPLVIGVGGASLGSLIVGATAVWTTHINRRMAKDKLDHDRSLAEMADAAAQREDTLAREREALTHLITNVIAYESLELTDPDRERLRTAIQAGAFQIDDVQLIAAAQDLDLELLPRAGYLLRTPRGERNSTGHQAGRSVFRELDGTVTVIANP